MAISHGVALLEMGICFLPAPKSPKAHEGLGSTLTRFAANGQPQDWRTHHQ